MQEGTSKNNLQIKYAIFVPLATYYDQVRKKTWSFPSFRDACPICSAGDCAIRHGFYFRWLLLENWGWVFDFPVARYRCRGKGKRRVDAVTFSLLPEGVAPYRKFSLEIMLKILRAWIVENRTVEQVLDFVAVQKTAIMIFLSVKALRSTQRLFDEAYGKLSIDPVFGTLAVELAGVVGRPRRRLLLERIKTYPGRTAEAVGIVVLDREYYSLRRGYFGNAPFLFGTPSQFRRLTVA